MEKTTLTERLAKLRDWYTKKYGVSVRTLEDKCGLGNSYFNNRIRDKKEKPSPLMKILENLPEINRDWLVFGDGPMLMKDVPRYTEVAKGSAPYYDVDFLGGFDFVENSTQRTPDGYIRMEPYTGKDYFWCNLTGDSMFPLIKSGSRICMKYTTVPEISYGKIYGLVIKGESSDELLRTVKWVVRADNESMIRLVPENKDIKYGGYEDVPIVNIIHVFKVVFTGTVLQM